MGIDGIFATRNVNNCENCRDQRENGLIDSDVIPLTTPLVAYWKSRELVGTLRLKSLEPDDVKPFLARNLRWRVLDVSLMVFSLSLFHPGLASVIYRPSTPKIFCPLSAYLPFIFAYANLSITVPLALPTQSPTSASTSALRSPICRTRGVRHLDMKKRSYIRSSACDGSLTNSLASRPVIRPVDIIMCSLVRRMRTLSLKDLSETEQRRDGTSSNCNT